MHYTLLLWVGQLLGFGLFTLVIAGGTDFIKNLNNEELFSQITEDQIALGRDLSPSEKYYLLALKVNEAVTRRFLTLVPHTRVYDQSGTTTDLYGADGCDKRFRLPSIVDVISAERYFESNSVTEPPHVQIPNICTEDFLEDPVRDMQVDMLNIKIDKAPEYIYYLLVLKVSEAFKKGYIKRVPDSHRKGEKGVNTELYKVVKNNDEVLLPSVKDLDEAKDYFKRTTGGNLGDCKKEMGTLKGYNLIKNSNYNQPERFTSFQKEKILDHLIENHESENNRISSPKIIERVDSKGSKVNSFVEDERKEVSNPSTTYKERQPELPVYERPPVIERTPPIKERTFYPDDDDDDEDDDIKRPTGCFGWLCGLLKRRH